MCEAAERCLTDGISSVTGSQLNTRLGQNVIPPEVISDLVQVVFTTARAEEEERGETRGLQQ